MCLLHFRHKGIVRITGNHSQADRTSMRTEYSVFNINWYIRSAYNVPGCTQRANVLGASSMVEYCTYQITFAIAKFVRYGRSDALLTKEKYRI